MSSGDGGLAPSSRNSGRGSGAAADDDGEEGAAARPAALRARAAITQSSPSMPRISRSSMDLPTSPALSERDYSDGLSHKQQWAAATTPRETKRNKKEAAVEEGKVA